MHCENEKRSRPRNILINGRRFSGGRYPFDLLAIGESFFVPFSRSDWDTVTEMVRRRNKKGPGVFEPSHATTGEERGTMVTRLDPAKVILARTSVV